MGVPTNAGGETSSSGFSPSVQVENDDPYAPVERIRGDSPEDPQSGLAISLSGGGYRAMLFHTGALWRMGQLGVFGAGRQAVRKDGRDATLDSLERISSVSGGSIVAAQLALRWNELRATHHSEWDARFRDLVVEPIRALARVTLAGRSPRGVLRVLGSIILPGSPSEHVARAYAKHLYGKTTLASIPDSPTFVINAANLQSGALWRFSSRYAADWRVGMMENTAKVSLASAVAASSAFPPFLAPARFTFVSSDYKNDGELKYPSELHRPPFTTKPQLADGGVYDNLGIETTYKKYRTLFVSNAGAPFDFRERVPPNWLELGGRVIGVIDLQVLNLRKRLLLGALTSGKRRGAFWDIAQNISTHKCPDSLPCPVEQTSRLAAIPTDLEAKNERTQERLINWGYAVTDAALRAHANNLWPTPVDFPYPEAAVG